MADNIIAIMQQCDADPAKAAEAIKEAQKNADALLKPYVDSTALKLP